TLPSIYDVPLNLQQYRIGEIIGKKLELGRIKPDMKEWEEGGRRHETATKPVTIAMVGKYTNLEDAYLSVNEALKTAAVFNGAKVHIEWVDSEKLERKDRDAWDTLKKADGILVPGGFGKRGIEGK